MATVLSSLATVADLSARLGVAAPTPASVAFIQMQAALDDASGDLRGVIGQALNQGTSTVTVRATPGGYVRLPAVPATAITSVLHHGVAVWYRQVDSATLFVPVHSIDPRLAYDLNLPMPPMPDHYGWTLSITYTHGWAVIPAELVKWTCVMAAASLAAAKSGNLGLAGGLSSVGVDDARATWATNVGEQGEGITIPVRVADRLRASYGTPSITVEYR